jgi:hypothetical protein
LSAGGQGRVLRGGVYQLDVAPAPGGDKAAGDLDHLGGLIDADDPAVGADPVSERGEVDPGAAGDVEHRLAGAQERERTARRRTGATSLIPIAWS